MIGILILVGVVALGFIVYISTQAPNVEEKAIHRKTQKRYREAITLIERATIDPLYPTTIEYKERAADIVERYYEEE
jgi:Tfp pilus assembly protein PilO